MAGTVNKKTCATCKYWQLVDDQNIPISDPPTPTMIAKDNAEEEGHNHTHQCGQSPTATIGAESMTKLSHLSYVHKRILVVLPMVFLG